jgi:tetratricopeptide (TPR) repeat protein
MPTDARGNPVGSADASAREHAERALWRLVSFYDTPLADLDAAIAADPGWLLPHVMKAGFLTSLTEPALLGDAAQAVDAAAPLEDSAPPRERAHLRAARLALAGQWRDAQQVWDALLLDHPRDLMALQFAHLWDFYRGDARALCARPARVLRAWSDDDPLKAHVLAMHAFGLEECHRYPEAEDAGRRALDAEPRAPWAVHAVAHVMEMQGRHEEGAAWLRGHQPQWAEGNGFAVHLWWHLGLFRLEALDIAGALRLADAHIDAPKMAVNLERLDAAALLWRLMLLGVDVRERCARLAAAWPDDAREPGHYAFNDVHALIARLGAGDVAGAQAWFVRCNEAALAQPACIVDNQAMAREVGLPLQRALLAFARGEHAAAVDALWTLRGVAHRFGGSHAQRDLIDQTLLAAAAKSGSARRAQGQALLEERIMNGNKAATPLTRRWLQELSP